VHSIRHGAVTAMLEAGIHIKAVSVLVGHSNVATTAKIYAHVSDDVSRSAMDALSAAMGV
ncbi:MAG: tyrosine-type recombinase/integrase, partial [Aeromicrobium sp.]